MPASLENQFISDLYTSLLHLSGAQLGPYGPLNKIFDGAGNSTGLALSGKRVVINNYIYPIGFDPQTRPPDGITEWLDAFFPVGCLQLTFHQSNPKDRIAGTDWRLVSQGRFLVGVGTFSDRNGDTFSFCPGEPPGATDDGNIVGEYKHQLTVDEMPSHWHTTNIAGPGVQVSSDVGDSCPTFESHPERQESSLSFKEQAWARTTLMARIGWNVKSDYGFEPRLIGEGHEEHTETIWDKEPGAVFPAFDAEADRRQGGNFMTPPINAGWPYKGTGRNTSYDEYLGPVKRGMDLNFQNGSAANYPVEGQYGRNAYLSSTNWNFVEMVGIWNGETRFIASRPAGERNIPGGSRGRPYQYPLRNVNWYDYVLSLGAKPISEADDELFLSQNNETQKVTGASPTLNIQEGANNNAPSSLAGGDERHNNIPPSYGVYVWERIA